MSRIGKLAIKIPDKVKVTAQPGLVNVEGPKGKVAQKLDREMKVTVDKGEIRVDRPNAREHVSFGHGIHTCPGAPLARAEARVSIERLLDRMADIRISEAQHGPAGARRYEYTPIYLLRGLEQLHLEFTPVG